MQTKGPAAGWSWLVSGFTALHRHPGAVLGAAALMLLCATLPAAIQFVAQPYGVRAMLVAMGIMAIVTGLLYPVLYGGYMRLFDAIRHDRPANAWILFDAFRPGRGGARLVLFGVCMLVTYVVFFAIVLTTIGHAVAPWYVDLLAQQAHGAPPTALHALPPGFGGVFALLSVFFLFYSAALAIGTGQVALRARSAWAGFTDGVAGAFKNVLPLVVLTICGLLAMLVAIVALAIIVTVFALLGHLVGAVFGLLLGALLYIAFLLALLAVIMGVNYAVWHDVADAHGNDVANTPVASPQG